MKKYFWLIVILIIGAILRYYHNTDISLWHDEAFSALLIKYNWSEMMYRIGLDVHPPAYYVFLRLWHYVFGDSLLSLRSFTVFFSLGTVWASWLFVKEAFKSEKFALWAAALVALNPFQIQYATEARMYTMGAFFAVLAAYFLTKALELDASVHKTEKTEHMPNLPEVISSKKKMVAAYAGFVLSTVIIIYTHYYLLFTAAAICFYGLVYIFRHHLGQGLGKYKWLLISFVLIVLAYLPWLKVFLFQYRQVGAGYWIPPMDRWSIPSVLYTLLFGFSHDVNQLSVQKILIFVALGCLMVLWLFLKKTQNFSKWLVFLAILAPFLGSLLFLLLAKLKGSNSSVFLVRYFLYSSAFLSVMLAGWLVGLKQKKIAAVLFVVYLVLNFWAFLKYWDNLQIQSRPGMNAGSKYLKANIQPTDKLYAGSSFIFFNLKYYVSQTKISQRPLLFTGGTYEASSLPHFAGTAILTNQDLLPDFNTGVKPGEQVWLVWTSGFGSIKPQVPKNWAQLSEKEYPEVRPYLGASTYVTQYVVN